MTTVIDVSAVVEILLQKEKCKKYRDIIEKSSSVLAPDIYVSELANTLWKYYTRKLYTETECKKYIQLGIGYIDRFINCKDIWQEAFSEGINNKHSVYDLLYMVTARRNGGTLITSDSALAAICKKCRVEVCY